MEPTGRCFRGGIALNLVSFQFSRISIPPKIFPTVSLQGPVSTLDQKVVSRCKKMDVLVTFRRRNQQVQFPISFGEGPGLADGMAELLIGLIHFVHAPHEDLEVDTHQGE